MGRREMDRREQVSLGSGIVAALVVGLVVWFSAANAGAAVMTALLVGASIWLWFRRVR
jgi:hypothetical protein